MNSQKIFLASRKHSQLAQPLLLTEYQGKELASAANRESRAGASRELSLNASGTSSVCKRCPGSLLQFFVNVKSKTLEKAKSQQQ